MSRKLLEAVPEIGDRIEVLRFIQGATRKTDRHEWASATVISMEACRKLAPKLFGHTAASNAATCNWREKSFYVTEDTIRAFQFDDGEASFCIMRFAGRSGSEFNSSVQRLA